MSVKTVFHDSTTFTLNETDLATKTSPLPQTKRRDIPYSNGLKWWVDWAPEGLNPEDEGYLSVFLNVSGPVKARYSFSIERTSVKRSDAKTFDAITGGFYYGGWSKYQSHEELRPLFHDGRLTIRCDVEFDLRVSYACLKPSMFESCGHILPDMELVLESGSVLVHKHFLSMISPVFNAMFTYNTCELKSGKVKITEFDFDTVKAAIDFCYGREIMDKSIHTIVNILRFADKYDIKAVTQLQEVPSTNLFIDTFCAIIRYAYDCSKDELLTQCYQFFKEHQKKLKTKKEFVDLAPELVTLVLKSAFDLKTDFDVLHYACKNEFTTVVEHLEHRLLTSMTLNDFCAAVGYAWECSSCEFGYISRSSPGSHLRCAEAWI